MKSVPCLDVSVVKIPTAVFGAMCTMPGEFSRHAVAWIERDGETFYWDAIGKRYATEAGLGTIHCKVTGPSRGAYDYLPVEPIGGDQ